VNFTERLLANWRAKLLGAVIIAALGTLCWGLSLTQGLTYFSYDFPFVLRFENRPTEALIVFMDDESRIRLKQPVEGPWNRALHVRLLNELFADGAKAVVFDVLFDEPHDKVVDEQFAAAIKAHGHIVLGASVRPKKTGGKDGVIVESCKLPYGSLGTAAPWGVAEMPQDEDGTIRRHYYDESYTNLSWQAAIAAAVAPDDREQPRWIDYYGPAGTIPHVSYDQVLNAETLPSGEISNKVVFVGMAPIIDYQGSVSFDEFKTPYSWWAGTSTTGVEIQATAFLNLARRDWLTRLPMSIELLLIVMAALSLGFLLPVFRPRAAFGLGLLGGVAVTAAATFLALRFHVWFCWAIIPVVEVPAGLTWYFIGILNQRAAGKSTIKQPKIEPDEFAADGPPKKIPDHELIRFLAKGAYGEVWLAKTALGTFRGVKIVRRQGAENEGALEREYRGIQAFEPISRSHEGFVDILHIGRRNAAGYFYYIMELADDQNTGQTIAPESYRPKTLASEISRRGKIACDECVEIGLSLALALQKLHDSNLVHRDIKPANIIFVGGIPKLADIGLVAETSESASIVGTKGFLAPEGPGSPQADVYSLGKTLYEAAMGRDRCAFPELPTEFAEDPEREKLMELNAILLKACEFSITRRYRSAEKMHVDLRRLSKRIKSRMKASSE
jgi:CHASE2 domain-containing sensor protein